MFKDKKIAVLGGEGMIGKELVEQLKSLDAKVFSYDIKNGYDLSDYNICMKTLNGKDFVFSLVGVKGNPRMTQEKPLDFMFPMLRCDTNIIKAVIDCKIKRFLYTSSIAVEYPEDDRFPAHAKLTGELLLEAAKIQYPEFRSVIVRPSNCYGRYDNFDNPNAMVITSLINKAIKEGKIELYNNTAARDFVNAKDVANGMIKAMKEMPNKPVNLCSGKGIKVIKVAEMIADICGVSITWVSSQGKVTGTERKVMKINWDFKPEIDIKTGLKDTIKHAEEYYARTPD